mgnify:CR=1 FL=1
MNVFLGGIVAAFLGIVGILVFFKSFLNLLAGAVPLMLDNTGIFVAHIFLVVYDHLQQLVDACQHVKRLETRDDACNPAPHRPIPRR